MFTLIEFTTWDCPNREQWNQLRNIAELTKDTFWKALNEWYYASIVCLSKDDPCYKEVVKQWNTVNNFYDNEYQKMFDLFWGSLTKESSAFSEDICNQYRKMMIDWRCHIKKLMRLVDGDFSGQTITNISNNTGSSSSASFSNTKSLYE